MLKSNARPTVSASLKLGFSIPLTFRSLDVTPRRGLSICSERIDSAEAETDHAATCAPARIRNVRRSRVFGTSGMARGGPGIEARTSLSAARRRACVHRLQYFRRRRVGASRVEGRLRRVFQAELDHFGNALAAQLRNKGQHEIDACRDAASG